MLDRLGSLDAIREFIGSFSYPIVVTRGRLVEAVNDAWIDVFGFTRDQVEGHPWLDFMPPEERTRLDQRATLREQAPTKMPIASLTSIALKADGHSTLVHVRPSVIPVPEGPPFVLTFLFVAPDRDDEIELAQLLVAASSSLAKARTVIEVRQLAASQLGEAGYTVAFFRRDGTAIHPEAALLPSHTRREELEEAARENRLVFVGQEIEAEAVILPIQRGTELELMLVSGPSLVTHVHAALQLFARGVASALDTAALIADLERRNRELSDTRAELVRHERLAALGEMAASVAHEVRNPVGVISNAVSTLRRQIDGTSGELLSIVDEECARLERMVRDLLEFARPRPVSFTLETLSEVAEEAIAAAAAQPDLALRDPKFELERDDNVPKVSVDRDLLRQALVNLLVNGAQASPPGSAVRIRVAIEQHGGALVPTISVIDRGGGIAPSIVERIFDPFFTTRAQGTGLGLAVVRKNVDSLRTQIAVESMPGKGATFRLVFPS